jgi:molybdopterin-guanine dinucleotide biosynthesis protein
MQVVSICGIRGSGKTTLIRKLIALLSERGKRAGVIVNEDGEEGYPEDFIETHGIHAARIRGG